MAIIQNTTGIRTNPPLRLTIGEAAEYATVSHITIRRALKSRALRSARLGSRHVIKLADLDAWIDSPMGGGRKEVIAK
jgi:excisionase family DNA binding protein